MAEREAQQKLYAYGEMSNKVQQADRSQLRSRTKEGTGEVESLRGRADIGRMGDSIAISSEKKRSNELEEKIMRAKERVRKNEQSRISGKKKGDSILKASGGQSILDLEDLSGYQPTHGGSRNSYEKLLTLIKSKEYLGNQPTSILVDAANEIILQLKNDKLRDPERLEVISQLLTGKSSSSNGGLTGEKFSMFIGLGKGIDDFEDYTKRTSKKSKSEMDDEMGVAVVFDSDDDAADNDVLQEGDDAGEDEVVEFASTSSESDAEDKGDMMMNSDADEDGKLIQGGNDDNYDQAPSSKRRRHTYNRVLTVHEIDAHYLQRQLSSYYDDATNCAQISNEVLKILDLSREKPYDLRECENKLLVLLESDLFDLIKLILNNRVRIWGCISLKRAKDDTERDSIEDILKKETTGEGMKVWKEAHSSSKVLDWTLERMKGMADTMKNDEKGDVSSTLDSIKVTHSDSMKTKQDKDDERVNEAIELDLNSLVFRDGSHTMTNKKCDLPDKSWRGMKKGYEEVHVPATRTVISNNERLIPIKELPEWTHDAFKGMDKLNRIQSKMCETALRSSENVLLCAPTGAGKTNVAMLTMLNILGQYRKHSVDDEVGNEDLFSLNAFKIVYVAPMKALVQEIVKNFSRRLEPYGVTVKELSGDATLTQQQISETQVLVVTPEKWDIITRQGEGKTYTQLVRLIIIDEIHLLHDDRGPVLESIVSRVIRQVETTSEPVRLVGLSATLPNYSDVATFLRVKPDKGLFFFDHSYRPVPLQMQYIGISERNSFKRFKLQNEICYEKALSQRREGNQMLIFVHSRAETGKTAKELRDLALERDELSYFVREGGATQEILKEEVATVNNSDLKEVLSYGFALHHAGMDRSDRELVEDLFADGHISVLCSTATLAWGVNLPAHAVIIKGTQIYDPSKGCWTELSPLDVLQMLGRAGRPQYDSEGVGIVMTAHSELQFYLSLMNLQLPVESQLIKSLPDHLNAEIVLGTVQTIAEAADWLTYTFLYVRMLQKPGLYGIFNPEETLKLDPTLKKRRLDLAHTAACMLEKSHLIRYDRKSGALQSTPLGRISSQYYISHSSMALYGRQLRPNMADIDILRLFSLSGEFTHITVREEEKLELVKLAARVPIPVKESPSEPSAKINILLQAYISRLKLDGFALVSDMAFIQQSAARIMRAIFEIALRRNWSSLGKLTLSFSKMIDHRIWQSQSPLRQFRNIPDVVSRKLERKSDIEWSRYFDLTPSDLGELVGVPKMGRTLHKLVHQFPKIDISGHVQPITRSMLRVELTLVPDFEFDIKIHGYSLLFHLIVEDVNGDIILHHDSFSLKRSSVDEEQTLSFTVPVLDPLPPLYFIRLISDRYLHSESCLPILFGGMILPPKFSPPTELLDLQPLPPIALGESSLGKLYSFKHFNPIQTQAFHELFKTDRNVLVCAPPGSGKTVCAEFAIHRMLINEPNGKCVMMFPNEQQAVNTFNDWSKRFGSILEQGQVVKLSGDTTADLRLLSEAKIILCTSNQWDSLSRRWRQRKAVQAVSLFIVDEIHFLGGDYGPTMEVIISRMRYISSQKLHQGEKNNLRIVGLGACIANAREIGNWMGVPNKSLFNFSPRVRPTPLNIYLMSFDQNNFASRLMAMAKPVYNAVARHAESKPAIVFVPSRRQAQLTAIDLLSYHESLTEGVFFHGDINREQLNSTASKFSEHVLQQVLPAGIAYVHQGMKESDFNSIVDLFRHGVLGVLVCPYDLCWRITVSAHLVVIMGTETYNGREKRYIDYPVVDLLHMVGKASRQEIDSDGKCVILCHTPKKDHLKKLLYDPLPIESHLDHHLHDHFNSEIVTKTIGSMQDAIDYITWTLLYRRISKNPNYYNLEGTTNTHLSEHLSEMVETVLGDLEESKCCQMNDDGDVSPLNLGLIAAYYYVKYTTIELIASSVTAKTKIRGVIEILSASSEFSSLPIRHGDEKTLRIMARKVKYQLPDKASFNDSNTKALILLQSHFSRTPIPSEMQDEKKQILGKSVTLIQSIVDVISSIGWLKPALAAMELSQMIVQGLWSKDNILMQIPHFSKEIVERCKDMEGEDAVESIFDIICLEDDVRDAILQLPADKMTDVADFCNSYPNIDMSFNVLDANNIISGDPVEVIVHLEREIDEDDMDDGESDDVGVVCAPLFPKDKIESWWIVIGDTSSNKLLSLKRVSVRKIQKVKLEFIAPEEAGDYDLTLFCMSDSYLGCDQEYSISLSVAVADSDDDEEIE